MRTKYLAYLMCGGLLALMLGGCALDYTNTGAINPGDVVWDNPDMIEAYLNDIHGGMMPGWPIGYGNDTDEALNEEGKMDEWARGVIGVERSGVGFSYEYIDRINFLLEKLDVIPESVLSAQANKYIKGQALFWRAWSYFSKVKTFGGVPLILKFQNVNDYESLFIPRSKTSECVDQIIKDLDGAIVSLPDIWDDTNYGRIDKGTAMAVKGRVLLWYASPLFNLSNDKKRWEDAYDVNLQAVNFLKGVGKGLYPDFSKIWEDEQNEEVIMVNQYYYPDHPLSQNKPRPEPFTKDYANFDQPVGKLLMAFPQKDGSPLEFDKERLSDPVYNADLMKRFYNNRDDRFYATIFCGGTKYPSTDTEIAGQSYWCTWMKNEDGSYINMGSKQMNKGVGNDLGGFFSRKGLDVSLNKTTIYDGETDWVEIRFAEVLMNYGECANEADKSSEALQVLYDIRKRAGIDPGANKHYGITATTKDEIRDAYVDERLVEFAYEDKRSGDLKRWKRWNMLNEMKHRWGIHVVINDNADVNNFDWRLKITDPEGMKLFHIEYIDNLAGSDTYTFNYDLDHWFNPIRKDDMDRNSKLKQNVEWGGEFDPYQ